ncbi:MAG: UDP-N-acetylglucosamine 1-carboxyvinyltransferase [bacterium]|nr:UDP-N-acetylglucosamine 1-carboxyvinyltransferase [bacterium]
MTKTHSRNLKDDSAAYVIRGGKPIGGEIEASGNKNATLPILAACVLGSTPSTLEHVPEIRDVAVMIEALKQLGLDAELRDDGNWTIGTEASCEQEVEPGLAREIRASFLLAGPLLGRHRRAVLPRPGGDRIGRRPLDTHIHALQELGATVAVEPDRYVLQAPRGLQGADIFLQEMSVMATENIVMAASLAKGTTIIRNAASEPHVQELCRMINGMGGSVDGIGTSTITVEGREDLSGTHVRIGPDPVEVGSFIGLAAVTGGGLRIRDANPLGHHRMTAIGFGRLGIRWEVDGQDIVVPANQDLVVQDDLHGAIPKIDDGPWPAFPPDLTSIAVVLATQSRGTILIHEKMFESRLFWVDRLIAMGARIVLCDPHRVVVAGPSALYPQHLASPDIRAGMALVIAALCADGESIIHNIRQVERGYANLHQRLRDLGADVERVEG